MILTATQHTLTTIFTKDAYCSPPDTLHEQLRDLGDRAERVSAKGC